MRAPAVARVLGAIGLVASLTLTGCQLVKPPSATQGLQGRLAHRRVVRMEGADPDGGELAQRRLRQHQVGAAAPDLAIPLYEAFVDAVKAQGIPVATGRFGAMMQVELVNDGPVTLIVEASRGA